MRRVSSAVSMNSLRGSIRYHLPFVILIPTLLIVMTFPTIRHVFAGDEFWLVQDNIDANMLFWDAWYFERILAGEADYFFTDLLFHPEGVSLAFHNFSLPHMALLAALKQLMPPDNAFNLAYLLLAFVVAASGYLYLQYLFRDRWVACFGAIVFGLCGFVLARPAQIHIAFIATIPLTLYCFHRSVAEESNKLALLAGAFAGATAYIGLYTLVSLLILLGCFVLGFAWPRWRQRRYWLLAALMAAMAAVVALPRIAAMLGDPALSGALNKNAGIEIGTDLMWYFVNYKHPLLGPVVSDILPIVDRPGWDRVVYLGYIPLALLAVALWRRKTRVAALPWLGLALIFLVLRLGSVLTVNSTRYEHILLPKHYLTELLPQIFTPFWTPDVFLGGALLPFAVIACYGLLALARMLPARYRPALVLLLALAVAFEYYQWQKPYQLPENRLAFIDWLQEEGDQDSIRLINLPTGGQNSKVYAFYQTYNGYPHAEGRPTRTPQSAFQYMDANLLLRNWRAGKAFNCLPGNADAFKAAQAQLLADGFTHALLHHDRGGAEKVAANFVNVSAAYQDDYVSIYRLRDLHTSCQLAMILSPAAQSEIEAVAENAVFPWQATALLSAHPFELVEGNEVRTYSAVLYSLRDYSPLSGADTLNGSSLTNSDVIVFVHDPRAAHDVSQEYRGRVASRFGSCGRVVDEARAIFEVFLLAGFPCQLALGDSPLSIAYDNGIRLGNLLAEASGERLELALLWENLPDEAHAMSVQLFDQSGQKAHGQDFVFHRDALQQQTINLASVPPGDYVVKLIVYNYASGESLGGRALMTEERFERELDFMTVTVD